MSTWIGTPYLADELHLAVNSEARQRLASSVSSSLIVRSTRLSIVDDRTVPVAAARTWNSLLPQHFTTASSLSVSMARPKIHLFLLSFLDAVAVTVVVSDTLIVLSYIHLRLSPDLRYYDLSQMRSFKFKYTICFV